MDILLDLPRIACKQFVSADGFMDQREVLQFIDKRLMPYQHGTNDTGRR